MKEHQIISPHPVNVISVEDAIAYTIRPRHLESNDESARVSTYPATTAIKPTAK